MQIHEPFLGGGQEDMTDLHKNVQIYTQFHRFNCSAYYIFTDNFLGFFRRDFFFGLYFSFFCPAPHLFFVCIYIYFFIIFSLLANHLYYVLFHCLRCITFIFVLTLTFFFSCFSFFTCNHLFFFFVYSHFFFIILTYLIIFFFGILSLT